MGMNTQNKPVIQEWVWSLSWKQQAVLLSALRGCDTADKEDMTKPFCRKLRRDILENGGAEDSCEFMRISIDSEDIFKFTKAFDRYPVHFLLHLIHAAEVLGYNHPHPAERAFWHLFYTSMVNAFHMYPETKEQNDLRLKDGVDTCCHKT